MTALQLTLFDAEPQLLAPPMPAGFLYQPDFITIAEEAALVSAIDAMELTPYEFRGFFANRMVAALGFRYSYRSRRMERAPAIPPLLLALRAKVAALAGRRPEEFQQLLVTQYAPGVAIDWHRDRLQYGEIVGISLKSSATLRLRQRSDEQWRRAACVIAPRSVYVLSGESRADWEHSIPPVQQLRYSLTFRTFADSYLSLAGEALTSHARSTINAAGARLRGAD